MNELGINYEKLRTGEETMLNRHLKFAVVLLILCMAVLSGRLAVAAVVYTGYDIGSVSLSGSPNATNAASAFDLATGPLTTIDFESGIPAGVTLSGGFIGDASSTSVCLTADLHCYATSPTSVYRNNGATFEFASPIDAFGAYFTGWQIVGQTLTIEYLGGGTSVFDMPAGDPNGGTLFYGLTDFGNSITRITYIAGDPSTDAVGIDDVRFGRVVPIPAAVWLFATALIGFIGYSRRRVTA